MARKYKDKSLHDNILVKKIAEGRGKGRKIFV
jgi:hypothetical protein